MAQQIVGLEKLSHGALESRSSGTTDSAGIDRFDFPGLADGKPHVFYTNGDPVERPGNPRRGGTGLGRPGRRCRGQNQRQGACENPSARLHHRTPVFLLR